MKAITPLSLALLLSTSSCIIHARGGFERCERKISAQTLEQVQVGSSSEFVESLLGEPTTRSSSGEKSVVWRYERGGTNTYVLFEDGKVSKTWQD